MSKRPFVFPWFTVCRSSSMYILCNLTLFNFGHIYRYWNKPLWGAVYLILLNSALFKPLLSSFTASTPAAPTQSQLPQQQQQRRNDSGNYSVVLLDVLTKALQEHINSVPKNIREVRNHFLLLSCIIYMHRCFLQRTDLHLT